MGTSNIILDWHVSEEASFSDHMYIRFDIRSPLKQELAVRIPRRTNWPVYRERLYENITGLQTTINSIEDLDRAAQDITEAITNAFHSSSPLVLIRSTRDVPWWNHTLENKRKEVRKLFNRAKRTNEWATYHTSLTQYNTALRKSKRESWRDFCGKIDKLPSACRLQKALSLEHSNPLGSVKKPNGDTTTSRKETLECLVKGHFPECIILGDQENYDVTSAHLHRVPREAYERSKNIFTPGEISWAVNSFGPYKSPGGDYIYPVFLQQGLEILLPYLIKLYRASHSLEYVPRCWRDVRVIFIPKMGKRSPEDIRSYRPISLTSFILKTMEKILGLYMRSNALQRYPLDPRQHAYQAGKSTETALHELTSEIEDTLRYKEVLLCSFIDIQGAFDNTNFEVIQEQAQARGIDSSTIGWIIHMLKNRRIVASVGDETIMIAATRGCPQGGVLSPILWLLVMDQLLARLKTSHFSNVTYADDLVLMIRGRFESTISERMQDALTLVDDWCTEVGLSINPNKINCALFTNRRKITPPSLILNGITLKIVTEVKYLGVVLDQKLTWNPLLKHITNKANKAFFACQRMIGKTWGLNPQMVLWMYQCVIRPMISYAAFVWWPKTEQIGARSTLDKIQRLICLSATGAMSTCPSAALERLLGLSPLHLHIKRIAGSRAINLKITNVIKTSRPGHTDILNKLKLAEGMLQLSDVMVKTLDCRRNFTVKVPKRAIARSMISSLPRHSSIWYTDGSKTNSGTGAGIVGPGLSLSVPLGITPTIFQAETFAIEVCAILCLRKGYRDTEIYIISDSQAALLALAAPVFNSKLIWSCYSNLLELGRLNKVTLLWSPGHSDIQGNESADHCARTGADGTFYGPEPSIAYSKTHLAMGIRKWEQECRSNLWESSVGMRQTKKFLTYRVTNLDKARKLDRAALRTLTWYLTGHGPFNGHLEKIGKSQTDRCRFCNLEKETSEHLLFACDAIVFKRHKFFGAYSIGWPNADPIDMHEIVAFAKDLDLQFT